MILFIGDIHYVSPGDGSVSEVVSGSVGGIADDQELAACLEGVGDSLTHIVLLGDVYDAFVEYRHLIPRGPTRTLGVLARLADRGAEITYVAGNHDPWHRTYVEQELGFRLVRHSETRTLAGRRVYVAHGDQEEAGMGQWARRVTRHPRALSLFTALMPGDTGQGLAKRVSRFLRNSAGQDDTGRILRERARSILSRGNADLVVMAHSHEPAAEILDGGTYLNPGFWPRDRSVAVIDGDSAELRIWKNGRLEPRSMWSERAGETPR